MLEAFGSPSLTSVAAKIRALESQINEGMLVLVKDDEKPLKLLNEASNVVDVGGTSNVANKVMQVVDSRENANGVQNYIFNIWEKYEIQKIMMNANGFFFFKFGSKKGLMMYLRMVRG